MSTTGYHSVGLSRVGPNTKSTLLNNNSHNNTLKTHVIVHIDMDAYYCSIDRERYPHWRNRPICVVQNGTLVVSSNYYARCRGYPKMGAVELYSTIPDIMYSGSNMLRYRAGSRQWYSVLQSYSDKIVVQKKSIDEALLDITQLVRYRIQQQQHKYLIKQRQAEQHYEYHKQRHDKATTTWQAAELNIDPRIKESTGDIKVAIFVSQSTDPITASGVNAIRRTAVDKRPTYTPPENIARMTPAELDVYQRQIHPIDYVRCNKLQQDVCEIVEQSEYSGTIDSEYIGSSNNQWLGTVILSNNEPGSQPVTTDWSHEDPNNPSDDYMMCIGSQITFEIRCLLFDAMGLTTSAGIGHNPMIAKIASSQYKPNQQSVIRPSVAYTFIKQFELSKIPGFGPKAQQIVAEHNLITIEQVQQYTQKQLITQYGTEFGQWLYNISQGIDHTVVEVTGPPKSIGQSKRQPTITLQQKIELLEWCATKLTERIFEDTAIYNRRPSSLVLTWAHGTWKQISRRCDLPVLYEHNAASVIFDIGVDLLKKHAPQGQLLMLSLTATNFVSLDQTSGMNVFLKSIDNGTSNVTHANTVDLKYTKPRTGISKFFTKQADAATSTTQVNNIKHNSDHSDSTQMPIKNVTTNDINDDDVIDTFNHNDYKSESVDDIHNQFVYDDNVNDDDNEIIDLFADEQEHGDNDIDEDNDHMNDNAETARVNIAHTVNPDKTATELQHTDSVTQLLHDNATALDNVKRTMFHGDDTIQLYDTTPTPDTAKPVYELTDKIPTPQQAIELYKFNVPRTDVYTCTLCNKQILQSNETEHTDYHAALKIQEEIRRADRIAREQEQMLKQKHKSNSNTTNKSSNTLDKFITHTATNHQKAVSLNRSNNTKTKKLDSFFKPKPTVPNKQIVEQIE